MQLSLKEVARKLGRNFFVRRLFETRQKSSVCNRELFPNQYQIVIKHISERPYYNKNFLRSMLFKFGDLLSVTVLGE